MHSNLSGPTKTICNREVLLFEYSILYMDDYLAVKIQSAIERFLLFREFVIRGPAIAMIVMLLPDNNLSNENHTTHL